MEFMLLAFPALLSIINPLGGAFIFLGATGNVSHDMREHLAKWVAIHGFLLLNVSLYMGAYVLEFFGISMPILRVAGGIVITASGWNLLHSDEKPDPTVAVELAGDRPPSQMAFYPLTMPLTTGPGTISVAISLGTNHRKQGLEGLLTFVLAASLTTATICLLIYVMYRSSDRIAGAIGPTGTTILLRLSAFLLFCIGIQVFWNGLHELLGTLFIDANART
ncbi:MAG: NAAT family transporter [Burkholderiales bacterium]|nr:NAAT family transporter [Burkholderiales bacterium]